MSASARFDGRVAVVIGGTSGIGLATAQRLHREGARVVVAARREAEGEAAVAAVGVGTVFHRVDVRQRDDVDDLFATTAARTGRLDVVVNCAGALVVAPTMTVKPQHWQRTIDVNLTGVFHACQAAVPHLRATIAAGLAEQAAIVNVVSIDALAGDRGFAAYNAAKAGALNFSRSLALELARESIRVNAVSPGVVDTPMIGAVRANDAAMAAFRSAVPAARLGRPEEIAAAIAFVASDDASFMFGANLVIDGGVTAGTGHPNMLGLFS